MRKAYLAAALLLAPAAHAQYLRAPAAVRTMPALTLPALPVAGALHAPGLTPAAARASLLPAAPIAAPMIAPMVTPAAPAAAPVAQSPLAKAPVADSLSGVVNAVEAAKAGPAGMGGAALTLSSFFDAAGGGWTNGPEGFRPPDGWEDRRINAALKALSRSTVGLSVYQAVYQKHGSALSIKIDDDRSATYDARLTREDGRPVLYLTQSLVDNGSPEATAAFIAREFADLYFEDFPASAERAYMSYGVMTRSFAEMTGSGLARDGYYWDRSRDRYQDGAYVLERYYGSWKEAAQSRDPRESAFFRFLQSSDDSNADSRSKLSLREQYDRGLISYSTYRQMRDYFDGIVRSEVDWLSGSGRW